MEDSPRREMFRRGTAGGLAGLIGFALSGFVLIPMWLYWLPDDNSGFIPTVASLGFGMAYAIAMAVVVSGDFRGRWRTAAVLVAITALAGLGLGAIVRGGLLDSCLLGTGPQPDWCYHDDPNYLRWTTAAYVAAGGLLGLALFFAGKVGAMLHSTKEP